MSIKMMVKAPDKKFYLCRFLGLIYSPGTFYPKMFVQSLKGYPFEGSQFYEVEMSPAYFYVVSSKEVASEDPSRKTRGFDKWSVKNGKT